MTKAAAVIEPQRHDIAEAPLSVAWALRAFAGMSSSEMFVATVDGGHVYGVGERAAGDALRLWLRHPAFEWPRRVAGEGTSGCFEAELLPVEGAPGLKVRACLLCDPARRDTDEPPVWLGVVEPATRPATAGADTGAADLLALAAHELRSPLNAIRGWAQVLRKLAPLNAEQTRAVDAIERGVVTQARQIDALIEHRALRNGDAALDRQRVLLEPLIDDVVESLRPAGAGKHLRLGVRCAGSNVVDADPARLRQVFVNLVSNAIRFTPSGGNVQVCSSANGGWVRVDVADSGIGLSKSWLQCAFGGDRTAAGPGLGLGLARRIIGLHGGRLSARSDGAGMGATFTVELPRIEAA